MSEYKAVMDWLQSQDTDISLKAIKLINGLYSENKALQAEADLIDDFYIETLETINIKHMRIKQ